MRFCLHYLKYVLLPPDERHEEETLTFLLLVCLFYIFAANIA